MNGGSPLLGRALVALILVMAAGVLGRTAWNLSRTEVPAAVELAAPGDLGSGAPGPDFDLPTTSGGRLTLAELRGSVVVVDFWATWCGPCRPSLQRLQALHEQMQHDGVTVVGMGVNSAPEAVAAFASREGLTFPIVLGDAGVEAAYRVTALPTLFVLDRQGVVRYRHVGYAPGAETVVQERVRELLQEPVARPGAEAR